MDRLELTIPLILTQDTFLLSAAQLQRHLARQRSATEKWLDWHFGSFEKHTVEPPLMITLTRLAEDQLPADTLREHLESTRASIESWLLHERNRIEVHWQYEQQSIATARNFLVHMRIEGAVHG